MALAFQLVSKVIFQSSQKCESCLDQLQMDRSAGVLKPKVIYDVKRNSSVKARKRCHLRLMTLRVDGQVLVVLGDCTAIDIGKATPATITCNPPNYGSHIGCYDDHVGNIYH